jgi:hypothetical protein
MTGYCKYCRRHGVEVHRLERYPKGRILIRTEEGEAIGMCETCEASIPVSRDELLQAVSLWGKNSVHEVIGIAEYLNSLDDYEEYDAEKLIAYAPLAYQLDEDRRASLEGLVIAAARVRESDGSPRDKKRAAQSVFIPTYERLMHMHMGQRTPQDLLKEFGEKWYYY